MSDLSKIVLWQLLLREAISASEIFALGSAIDFDEISYSRPNIPLASYLNFM